MDPLAQILLGIGRTFIPILLSEKKLSTALKENASAISASVTGCAAVSGALAAPAVYAAFQGPLWGLGAALGLVSAPAWVPAAGGVAGLITVGTGVRILLDKLNYNKQHEAIRVGYHLCSILATASPNASFKDELATILRQYHLTKDDIATIESTVPEVIGQVDVGDLEEDLRRQILLAAATVARKSRWPAEMEQHFKRVADRLGLGKEASAIRDLCEKRSLDQENLVEGMFASCSHLYHCIKLDNAQPFLDSLKGWHPNEQKLNRSVGVGDIVTAVGSVAATAAGQPAVAQVIGQTWNACRTAATSLNDTRIDRGYDLISALFTRELGVKASEINKIRGEIDSGIETTLATRTG